MNGVAIYARYSSDQQREASIEDQVRLCKERAAREGRHVAGICSDHAILGASLKRPGIQKFLQDALTGKFEIILAEAMDRLSRGQVDIAGIYKRLRFAGVTMVTLSEGELGDLHIGLKGTMNALFLKDLADKTRRGLRDRVESGKSGGGNSYGYDVVKQFASDSSPLCGDRIIDKSQASIVRRIFEEFANGRSPKAIVRQLNKDGVPGPSGKGWWPTTIYGDRERGTGILNNELYIGRLVWNRLRYVKDPDTGKRVSRQNPVSALIIKDVPALRIIDQALWDRVKERQGAFADKLDKPAKGELRTHRRPRFLFSGILKCGSCGGGFGCATARNKGTCNNFASMRRERLEVLGGLQNHLMDAAHVEVFCAEYTRHLNRLRADASALQEGFRAELRKIDKEMDRLVDAIAGGIPVHKVKDRMIALDARKAELDGLLAAAPEPRAVIFHPSMGDRYGEEVGRLREALNEGNRREEAAEIIRGLIECIVLNAEDEGAAKRTLSIDLKGHLARILALGAAIKKTKGANGASDLERQVNVGCGSPL